MSAAPDWLNDEDAADIAEECIERFGRSFVPNFNGPDRRAAFVVLVDDVGLHGAIVDITAIPPAAVGYYEDAVGARIGRPVRALDFHNGDSDGKPAADGLAARAYVAKHIAGILRGRSIPGDMLARLFAARRVAYAAAVRGDPWTSKAVA